MICTAFLSAVWVSVCHIMPVWDQMQVYLDAMDFKAGNFQDMTGYIFMCPHQYGLTFLYEIFLVFGGGWRLLQYINALMIMCVVWSSYALVDELFGDAKACLYVLMGDLLFRRITRPTAASPPRQCDVPSFAKGSPPPAV